MTPEETEAEIAALRELQEATMAYDVPGAWIRAAIDERIASLQTPPQ